MTDEIKIDKIDTRARSADIIDWEENKVVKLFLQDFPKEMIDRECNNSIEAFTTGCTSMQCYGKIEIKGRTGIILDKIPGIPMTKLPEQDPLALFYCPRLLAEQHILVHNKKSEKLQDVRKVAINFLSDKALDILNENEKLSAEQYISSLPEGNTILHLDFHTENILVEDKNCVTIDWLTASRGYPEVEVGMMQFLFHDSLLFPGCSKFQLMLYSTIRGFIYNQYIKIYKNTTHIDMNEVKRWKIIPLIIRRAVWAHEFEKNSLSQQIKHCLSEIQQ